MAIEALRRHRTEQFQRRQEQGVVYKDHGLVVTKPDGTPVSPGSFNTVFNSSVRKSGLPPINFHAMRHGHISQLIDRGGSDPKRIQARAGHSSIQITHNIYGHLMPGADDDMVARFDTALRQAGDSEQPKCEAANENG